MIGKSPDVKRKPKILPSVEQTRTMVSLKGCHSAITGNSQSPGWKRERPMTLCDEFSIQPGWKCKRYGCLSPNSEAQRRPKSGSHESIEKKPRTSQFGQYTAKFETGNLAGKRPTQPNKPVNLVFWSFCLSFFFAATFNDITVGSHNLHSFNQSGSYHKKCIEEHGGIWSGQEHWLAEKQLSRLQLLGTQYVARSGMEQAVSGGLLVGRPFGGVSIAWSPNLDHLIRPLSNFVHKRVVGAELNCEDKSVLLLCIYMPFYNASRKSECIAETNDAIAMLDTIIEQHPDHLTILGGDFNSELSGKSPFDPLWRDFFSRHKLACCSSQFPDNSVTYHHKSLDQKKWIDHFVVSPSLLENDLSNFSILDDGDNFSDHYPIMMKMQISFKPSVQMPQRNSNKRTLNWAKQKASDIDAYTTRLQRLVDALSEPEVLSQCHATCLCNDDKCKAEAQAEYDALIGCLISADATLQRHKPGIQKEWWTDGLTELKQKSIETHTAWINAGRP